MTAPAHLTPAVAAVWSEVITAYGSDEIVGPDLEAYCGQVAQLRDAQARIASDGLITADPKGNPIPHPAIAIERAAQDEIRKWGPRFTPPRRR